MLYLQFIKYDMIYVKRYTSAKTLYNVNTLEIYELELSCLKRLQGQSHICQLIDYNRNELTLDLKWCGPSYGVKDLKRYRKQQKCAVKTGVELPNYYSDMTLPLTQQQFIDQWHSAFDQLEANNIVHFDLQGKNICLNQGHLTVIDFGIAVIDRNPMEHLKIKYHDFVVNGGYVQQKISKLASILEEFDDIGFKWL